MSTVPDYVLPDSVSANTPEQLKALANPIRIRILDLVLERAATVSELAAALGRPKSSVAHHVETLLNTGLVQVVRTRRVRAIDERFYGRTGRTIIYGTGTTPKGTTGQNFLVEAAKELRPGADIDSTIRHARIAEDQADEFFQRVVELAEDFTRLPRSGDTVVGFVAALFPTDYPTLPPKSDQDHDHEKPQT
ncbi:MAG: winged helix-turn-helix transcriptional regulator [bacterium]|nr:winged helix-turn-helix transcriptional regulator [Actinomycetes bacterium]MCP4964008.1 winged helix-turn-helix transcriptional regulator [bacterium]